MAIDDDSTDYWKGSEAADIQPYLAEYSRTNEAYPATAFHPVVCTCGSDRFRLSRARAITQRTCPKCGDVRYICRDGDPIHWEEAAEEERPEAYVCVECKGEEANVCLGFAGYPESPKLDAAKWFYVGVRCSRCGVLGCFNDGKVGRGPMGEQVFSEVAGSRQGGAR